MSADDFHEILEGKTFARLVMALQRDFQELSKALLVAQYFGAMKRAVEKAEDSPGKQKIYLVPPGHWAPPRWARSIRQIVALRVFLGTRPILQFCVSNVFFLVLSAYVVVSFVPKVA